MTEQVVILGDSVTVGAGFSGVDQFSCYATLLRHQLEDAGATVRVTCSALDGADTGYALRRFDRMVAQQNPTVVVISLGLNDACPPGGRQEASPDAYAANLAELADRTLQIDASPVIVTPSPRLDVLRGDGPAINAMRPYAERARKVAEAYHLPLIDLYEEFVAQNDLESLLPDRLHPGPRGHELIARQFAQTLIPLCLGDRARQFEFQSAANARFAVCR